MSHSTGCTPMRTGRWPGRVLRLKQFRSRIGDGTAYPAVAGQGPGVVEVGDTEIAEDGVGLAQGRRGQQDVRGLTSRWITSLRWAWSRPPRSGTPLALSSAGPVRCPAGDEDVGGRAARVLHRQPRRYAPIAGHLSMAVHPHDVAVSQQ